MSSFPNLPPAKSDGVPIPAPAPVPVPVPVPNAPRPNTPRGQGAGSAVADVSQPAQKPLIHPPNDEPVFMSDSEYLDDFLKDNYTIPLAVLGISTAISFIIYGYRGFMAGGPIGVIGACIAIGIAIAIGALCATAAGWIVAKIFSDDCGSAGSLIIRYSAIAAAAIPVFEALGSILGFFPAVIFSYPIMLGVTIFVAGLDLFRAIVFNVMLTIVYLMMFSFFLMSLAAS